MGVSSRSRQRRSQRFLEQLNKAVPAEQAGSRELPRRTEARFLQVVHRQLGVEVDQPMSWLKTRQNGATGGIASETSAPKWPVLIILSGLVLSALWTGFLGWLVLELLG
jgi:hypothetical protein